MLFRRIFPTTLLPCLSSLASGRAQRPSQVISLSVASLFTFSCSFGYPGPGSGGYYSSRCLQKDRKPQNVRVSVWWDLSHCGIPTCANGCKVVQAITAVIRSSGIKGPIRITAFGDGSRVSNINKEALSSMGVHLALFYRGEYSSAGEFLQTKLKHWVSENPPPVHLFIISGKRGLAETLHLFRLNGYNILLASKADAPRVLRSAATIMWDWTALVEGENVIGRQFNYPADGPYNSWYGHYEIPLQDPFAVVEQSNSANIKESPANLGDEPRGTWELVSDSSQMNEVFNKESLWRAVEDFINSERGRTIISETKTREGLAWNLQEEGPSSLKPLSELDMLHLVDALISEKKWIEEDHLMVFPFKLTRVTERRSQ